MKKSVLVFALFTFISAVHATNANAHNIGCGFGGWALKNPDTLILNVFGVTLNGICANQTFAITSGTLDCVPPKRLVDKREILHFFAANMDNLAKEMAQGKGESLNTLAEMMSIPQNNRALFGVTLQSNFSTIFPAQGVEAGQALDQIASLAESHHLL